MINYESVIIIKPSLSEKEVERVNQDVQNKIKEFTKEIKIENLGKRKLAYEIKSCKEGYYYVYKFELTNKNNGDALLEIERYYRITDEIIKFMNVKQD